MLKTFLPLAAMALAVPALAQDAGEAPATPKLTLEQETGLRCGVAFAMAQGSQSAGDPAFADYPEIEPRGREYFVRTMVKLMDDTGAGREEIMALAMAETEKLNADFDAIHEILPACFVLLDASGV